MSTVHGSNDAIVFENTVPEYILRESSIAKQPEATKLMENGLEVLRPVMMHQKMPKCKEEAMALFKGEALVRAINYKIKASVSIKEVWKMLTAILSTGADPNLLKKKLSAPSLGKTYCFDEADTPTVCSKYSTGSKRSDTSERPIGTRNIQNQLPNSDQFGRWHDLRDGIYQWEYQKDQPQKGTLKVTGSSQVVMKESVGNAANTKHEVETKQRTFEDGYSEYPCTAVCRMSMTLWAKIVCTEK